MGLTLYVDSAPWRQRVDSVAAAFPGLIPVVKGNGYGFGRNFLVGEAQRLGATEVAVGTVFELEGLDDRGLRPIVLTPSLDLDKVPVHTDAVLTIGSVAQLEHFLRHRPGGSAVVKVVSAARRHGVDAGEAAGVIDRLRAEGCAVHSVAIHPALAGSDDERLAEIESLIRSVPSETPVTLSHLGAHHYVEVRTRHSERSFGIRLGSALWHGNKSALALRATVLDVRPVHRGERVGYRATEVPHDGVLVIVDAGTAHGVQPLANGDSPFHFARTRLTLVEPPHMHVSLVVVPHSSAVPAPGDEVDVQRPLITTAVDRIVWR